MKKKAYALFIYFALILLDFLGIETSNGLIVLNFVLIASLIYIYKYSKTITMFLIFMSTYFWNFVYYYFFNVKTTYYTEYFSKQYYDLTLIIMSLFLLFLYIFSNKTKSILNNNIVDGITIKENRLLFIVSILIMVFIIVFGKQGQSILGSGSYAVGSQSTFKGFAISEYILLFVILAYKYSGGIKNSKYIIIFVSMLYMLKMIAFGGRVESLQLSILLFTLYYENKFSYKQLFIFLGITFLAFNIFGSIRTDILYYLKNPSQIKLFEFYNVEKGYKPSNAGEVIYNSTIFIGLLENHVLTIQNRIFGFMSFIMRIFLPTKFIPFKEAHLSNYLDTFSPAGGGGFITMYFYFYLGIVGVILITYYVSYLLNNAYSFKNEYVKFYVIMVLATFPRWLVYDPITLFKLSGYIMLLLLIFEIVHKKTVEEAKW